MLSLLLLAAAGAANYKDRRMLKLVAVVGISIFLPVPDHSYGVFYLFCILSELSVALLALLFRANASTAVVCLCAALVVMHALGFMLDGYPPLSPYRLIVPALEEAEIIACIILSTPLLGRIRNHGSPSY